MSHLVVGFDVGATLGVAVLVEQWGGFSYSFAGSMRYGAIEWARCVALKLSPSLVAIETPSGYIHEHARGKALLAAARQAGELVGALRADGHTVVECSAVEWRKALCGRGTATDARVKQMVRTRVSNWPARSNAHERDAAGVAMFCELRLQRERKT